MPFLLQPCLSEPVKVLVKCIKKFESDNFLVDNIILYKSDLTPKGPIYTKISTFKLKTPGGYNE